METNLTQEAVKKAIALYEEAIKLNSEEFIYNYDIEAGLCRFFGNTFKVDIYGDNYFLSFKPENAYSKDWWFNEYMFTKSIEESIIPRLEILKAILVDMQVKGIN